MALDAANSDISARAARCSISASYKRRRIASRDSAYHNKRRAAHHRMFASRVVISATASPPVSRCLPPGGHQWRFAIAYRVIGVTKHVKRFCGAWTSRWQTSLLTAWHLQGIGAFALAAASSISIIISKISRDFCRACAGIAYLRQRRGDNSSASGARFVALRCLQRFLLLAACYAITSTIAQLRIAPARKSFRGVTHRGASSFLSLRASRAAHAYSCRVLCTLFCPHTTARRASAAHAAPHTHLACHLAASESSLILIRALRTPLLLTRRAASALAYGALAAAARKITDAKSSGDISGRRTAAWAGGTSAGNQAWWRRSKWIGRARGGDGGEQALASNRGVKGG